MSHYGASVQRIGQGLFLNTLQHSRRGRLHAAHPEKKRGRCKYDQITVLHQGGRTLLGYLCLCHVRCKCRMLYIVQLPRASVPASACSCRVLREVQSPHAPVPASSV
eukprot:scaffold30137_cov23-Tisochrysis_lutea.AAC.1